MLMTLLAGGAHAGTSFASVHSLAMIQASDFTSSGEFKWLVIFAGITAFALLLQSAVIVGIAVGGVKAQKEMSGHIEELKAKILPFVKESHALVTDLTPQVKDVTTKVQTLVTNLTPEIQGITEKVNKITGHVEEIAGVAKDKVNEFSPTISAANETAKQANETVRATVMEANQKTRAQVKRVDGMITSTLDATAKLGQAIQHGISQPGREMAGVISGVKAAFETLLSRKPFGSTIHRPAQAPYRSRVVPYPPAGMGSSPETTGSAGEYGRNVKPELDL